MAKEADLGGALVGGAFWMFAMRWAIRGVGFFSLMVLARLLTPKDFGIVALANSLAALPTVILELGLETAVIRERSATRDYYNTAWTLRVIQMSIAALCVVASGPLIAGTYGDSRLTTIFPVMALVLWIQGFENIWTVSYRRNLNFRFDFAYNASTKLASAVMAVVLAFWLRSYWALVYAQFAGALFRVAVSFAVAPELPRPTLREWRSLWSFSQWTLVRSLADYCVRNADRLILGRIIGAGQIGPYALGRELADIPISEISAPLNRALSPGIARLQHDPERLTTALLKVLAAVATICFPLGIGLTLTSGVLVPILLGKNWGAAIPIVQLLGLASIVTSIYGVMGNSLVVIGYNRVASLIMWLRAIVLIAVGIPAAVLAGANGMAGTIVLCELAGASATLYFIGRRLPDFSFSALLAAIKRPAISAALMALVLEAIIPINTLPSIEKVGALLSAGALTYVASLVGLWQLSGRNAGPEALVLEQLRAFRRAV